jgi:hypothetical protein
MGSAHRRKEFSAARVLEERAVDVELRRIGALEAENGLLLVANREDRARFRVVARAFAREEFFRQLAHDVPLLGAGILRFVDQDVIEAAIELVEHPAGCLVAFEQAAGSAMMRSS